MIEISNETELLNQVSKIKDKMDKYPPYAIGRGLDNVVDYLNQPSFKESLYPPSQSGQKFIWSSEKQRRYVMANVNLPYSRTMNLANSGSFKVEKKYSSLYIYYENTIAYAKWVIGNFTQIIGHIARGWKPVNTKVTDQRSDVLQKFDEGTKGSWDNLNV